MGVGVIVLTFHSLTLPRQPTDLSVGGYHTSPTHEFIRGTNRRPSIMFHVEHTLHCHPSTPLPPSTTPLFFNPTLLYL